MKRTLLTISAAILLAACSAEPVASNNDVPDSELPDFTTGIELAAITFGVEPYAIGREWYAYDGTHVVTPEPWVYLLERDGEYHAFDIDSYYDDRGESGVFTIRTAAFDGTSWSEPESLMLSKNVKEQAACATVDPVAEVDCDGEFDLIFRTAWRALPHGGFAVQEPAVYVRNHFSVQPANQVAIVEVAELNELPTTTAELDALERRPSVSVDALHGRVGWLHDEPTASPRRDVQVHITSNLQVSQWRVDTIEAGDELTVRFEARCQRVLIGEQSLFGESSQAFDVTLPAGEYSGAYVQICDPETDDGVAGSLVDSFEAPPFARWPDAKSFDLIVEQLDGRVAVRIAAGHLLWNWTRGAEDDSETFDPIDLDAVWAQHYESE